MEYLYMHPDIRKSLGQQKHNMDARSPVRWGILGAGLISNDFVVALRTLPPEEHKVISIASSDPERAKKFAEKHDIPKYYGYNELSKDKSVDVIYIGSINSAHYDHLKLMLYAGKNVLCEKPLCLNAARAKEITRLARDMEVFLMEGVWSRFFPIYSRVKEEIAKGTIGDVMSVQVSMGFAVHERDRTKFRRFGGGGIYDFGIYPIQFGNWIFGEPEKIQCSGTLSEEGVDESAAITLLYPNHRMASILLTTKSDLPNEAHVFGTKGHLKLWPVYCPTFLETPNGTEEHPLPAPGKPLNYHNGTGLRYEAQEVRKCLLEGKIQSDFVPHSETEILARLMEASRASIGVVFPVDEGDEKVRHAKAIAQTMSY